MLPSSMPIYDFYGQTGTVCACLTGREAACCIGFPTDAKLSRYTTVRYFGFFTGVAEYALQLTALATGAWLKTKLPNSGIHMIGERGSENDDSELNRIAKLPACHSMSGGDFYYLLLLWFSTYCHMSVVYSARKTSVSG